MVCCEGANSKKLKRREFDYVIARPQACIFMLFSRRNHARFQTNVSVLFFNSLVVWFQLDKTRMSVLERCLLFEHWYAVRLVIFIYKFHFKWLFCTFWQANNLCKCCIYRCKKLDFIPHLRVEGGKVPSLRVLSEFCIYCPRLWTRQAAYSMIILYCWYNDNNNFKWSRAG